MTDYSPPFDEELDEGEGGDQDDEEEYEVERTPNAGIFQTDLPPVDDRSQWPSASAAAVPSTAAVAPPLPEETAASAPSLDKADEDPGHERKEV